FSESILRGLLRGDRLTLFYDVTFSPLVVSDHARLIVALLEREATGVLNLGAADAVQGGLRAADRARVRAAGGCDRADLARRPRACRAAPAQHGDGRGAVDRGPRRAAAERRRRHPAPARDRGDGAPGAPRTDERPSTLMSHITIAGRRIGPGEPLYFVAD